MLSFFQIVESTPMLFGAVLFAHIVTMGMITSMTNSIQEHYPAVQPPDTLFGYTPERLNGIYSTWGEAGCLDYGKIALYDFVAVMPCYSVFWGAWLFRSCRRANWNPQLSNIFLVTVISDVVETYLQFKGCLVYPEKLSDNVIRLASTFNQMKWIGIYGGMSLTIVGLIISRFRGEKPHQT